MSLREYVRPTCVYKGCGVDAVCQITAQWSLFDWLDYDACEDHIEVVERTMLSKQIDGWYPETVFVRMIYGDD